MYMYQFISDRVSEPAVKAIIAKADYYPADYTYTRRTAPAGFIVEGDAAMSVPELEKAAKKLGIWLTISSPSEVPEPTEYARE